MAFRRTTTCVLLIAGFTLLPVTPISAVTPGFELAADVHGSTIHVTLTFEPVPEGFAWGSLEASGVLDGLVGLVPARLIGDEGRPTPDSQVVTIGLARRQEGVYEGSATVQDGRWAIVAWPRELAFDAATTPGSPPTQFVEVGGPPPWVWLAIGAGAGVLIAALSLHSAVDGTQRSKKLLERT